MSAIDRVLEDSCKKADEDFLKDFKKNRQPILKGQITHLQNSVTAIEKKMEQEVSKGLKLIVGLEDELKDINEKLEALKKVRIFLLPLLGEGEGALCCRDV